MELFASVFRPLIWLLNGTGSALGKLIGLHPSLERTSVYTETELRQLVDISHQSGHLRQAERRLIHKVFEFSETQVREAMVPRTQVAAVSSDWFLERIAKAFRPHGYSRLPVYRRALDDIIGVIHSQHVMTYLFRPETFPLVHDLPDAPLLPDT